MPTSLRATISHAQFLAIAKLAAALEATDDPGEIRRIAAVVLKLDPEKFAQPPAAAATQPRQPTAAPTPSAAPPPPVPLSPQELSTLHRLLPHIRIERFTRRRDPSYWRCVLAKHPPPTQAAA